MCSKQCRRGRAAARRPPARRRARRITAQAPRLLRRLPNAGATDMRASAPSLLMLLALLALSGCLLGPDYKRPAVDTPAAFRFAESDTKDLVNTAWWEQFHDPALNDLIATALADNKDVKTAAARVEQFLGQFETTRSQLLPQVAAGVNAQRERVPL